MCIRDSSHKMDVLLRAELDADARVQEADRRVARRVARDQNVARVQVAV